MRYHGDLEVGESIDCGSIEVTKDEMVEFAERYDPQPFHVDEAAAAETMYGDLIASGWLTCALSARLAFKNGLSEVSTVGGRGVDELRWRSPVYAGDALSVTIELVEKFEGDDSAYGHVVSEIMTTNQHDVSVLTMTIHGFVAKRNGS